MHKFKLGDDALKLYLYLTQKKFSKKEAKKLLSCLSLCTQVLEDFVGTAVGGCLSKRASLELSLTICGIRKITSLNRRYRNREKATDVLSFPLHQGLGNGGEWDLQRLCLGDIYICREIAFAQAERFQISYYEELSHLFVHGFLHLLGYDHEISQKAEREMLKKEDDLLKNIIGSKKWKNLLK